MALFNFSIKSVLAYENFVLKCTMGNEADWNTEFTNSSRAFRDGWLCELSSNSIPAMGFPVRLSTNRKSMCFCAILFLAICHEVRDVPGVIEKISASLIFAYNVTLSFSAVDSVARNERSAAENIAGCVTYVAGFSEVVSFLNFASSVMIIIAVAITRRVLVGMMFDMCMLIGNLALSVLITYNKIT